MASTWNTETHKRGARHSSERSSNGYTVCDLRKLMAAIDDSETSNDALIRIDMTNLDEGGRKAVTISVEEIYTPNLPMLEATDE